MCVRRNPQIGVLVEDWTPLLRIQDPVYTTRRRLIHGAPRRLVTQVREQAHVLSDHFRVHLDDSCQQNEEDSPRSSGDL